MTVLLFTRSCFPLICKCRLLLYENGSHTSSMLYDYQFLFFPSFHNHLKLFLKFRPPVYSESLCLDQLINFSNPIQGKIECFCIPSPTFTMLPTYQTSFHFHFLFKSWALVSTSNFFGGRNMRVTHRTTCTKWEESRTCCRRLFHLSMNQSLAQGRHYRWVLHPQHLASPQICS